LPNVNAEGGDVARTVVTCLQVQPAGAILAHSFVPGSRPLCGPVQLDKVIEGSSAERVLARRKRAGVKEAGGVLLGLERHHAICGVLTAGRIPITGDPRRVEKSNDPGRNGLG
jgi:hypothetical protein